MITHYGLFWSERDVYWGKQKSGGGALLGREKTPLNRRGAPSATERKAENDYGDFVGLYCLYGDGELLYVGETGLGSNRTLFSRLKKHRKGPLAGRWDCFSWFGRKSSGGKCEIVDALAQLEATAIAIVNPGFNKQSGTFKNAEQVFQVPHEKAEGNLETKIVRLTGLVEKLQKNLAGKPAKRKKKKPGQRRA
ncbi:MAG: hypothetical protein ABIK83_05605 [Candidatus Zixiibacteriota bacterium]